MEHGHKEFIGRLGQSSAEEVKAVFQDYLRGCVREMVTRVMSEEVAQLCGPRYHPEHASECARAGNAPGAFWNDTEYEQIKRPRVRKRKPDGSTEEVLLDTYSAAQDPSAIQDSIIRSLICGVSTRDQRRVHPDAKGVSRSNVSRLWEKHGAEIFQSFRSRDLTERKWLVLFADGIHLSDELAAVVAMGVTTTGEKVILDFELGSSENYEVAKDLLERIKRRGFRPAAERILAVTDGGAGLRKAIKGSFPNVVLQRCLVHKERNLKGRISRKYHGELGAHFKLLRHAQRVDDARAIVSDLKEFLAKRSKRALESLEEAGEELLAFHSLEVPSTLNVSLLSTNCIENTFRNTRHKTGRVTRWRADSDQPQRWLACAFTEAEKGFKRIRGYKDLQELKASLDRRE